MELPSPSTLRLQNWFDRIQAGDTDARNELIEHYYPRFLKIVRSIVGPQDRLRTKEGSVELLQEAFVKRLHDIMDRMPPPSSQKVFWGAVHKEIRWAVKDRVRHYFGTKQRLVVPEADVETVEGRMGHRAPNSKRRRPRFGIHSSSLWIRFSMRMNARFSIESNLTRCGGTSLPTASASSRIRRRRSTIEQ
jgi:ECF sigma factor